MFKFIRYSILFFFIITCTTSSSVYARPVTAVYSSVGEGQTIFYSFKTNKWYYKRPNDKDKNILDISRLKDCEGYSEYVTMYQYGETFHPAGSNYEFIYKGKLITYHINEIKFFEIVYDGKVRGFIETPLDETEVKNIMGNPKIIHISDFDFENKIILTKIPFKTQSYLILNDTDKYFYNYSLKTPEKDKTIKTLFKVKHSTTIMYEHDKANKTEFPSYKIRIIF